MAVSVLLTQPRDVTEWLRAALEGAEPIERIHGEWIDEPAPAACNHGSVKLSTEYAGMRCATCGENIDPPPWLFGASENPTPGE